MRFTKRVLSLILAGAMAVSLVGCSGGSKTASNGLDANGSLLLALISVFLLQLEEAQIRLHVLQPRGWKLHTDKQQWSII